MSFVRAFATVGGLTLVSRVAGFARDVLTAAILGAGPVADAFFVALKLPNLFRRMFAEGAFAVSFVPMFSAELARNGRPSAKAFAEEALAVMVVVLVPLTVLAVAGMHYLVPVIAPGFVDRPDTFGAAVEFARITFPYLMMMSLVALLGSMLNAVDRFAPFASAPVLFNLSLIGALLGLRPVLQTAGHALAWGVAAAGAIQLVWLAAHAHRAGLDLRLVRPRLTPRIRKLFRLMAPGAVGAGVMQINLFVDTLLASLLSAGAISYLYYADRLYQLPLGVIGIAIGTAMLPLASRQVAAGAVDAAMATQNRAIEFGLLLSLPAAAALIAMPVPILTVLFERGAFGPAETAATALALAAYAIGIPAYILVKILSTAFFARHDTASPVRIAIICTVANILLSLSLIQVLGHVGIALSTGLTAWINAGLLARGLARRGLLTVDDRLRRRVPRLAFASVAIGAALYGMSHLLSDLLAADILTGAATLGGMVAGGAVLYFAIAHATGAAHLAELKALFAKKPA